MVLNQGLNYFLGYVNTIYSMIGSSFTERQKRIISILGSFILALSYFVRNMKLVLLSKESIPFFIKTGGFLWEGIFALGLVMLFFPLFGTGEAISRKREWSHNLLIPFSLFILFFGLSFLTAGFGRFKLVLIYLFVMLPIFDSSRDSDGYLDILKRFLRTMVYLGLVYYLLSYIFVPFGDRYPGLSLNPNRLSEVSLAILVSALALLVLSKDYKEALVLYGTTGISITFILVSESRTAQLTVIFIVLTSLFLRKKKTPIKRTLMGLLALGLCAILLLGAFNISKSLYLERGSDYYNSNLYFRFINYINIRETITAGNINTSEGFDFIDRFDVRQDLELSKENRGGIEGEGSTESVVLNSPILRSLDVMVNGRVQIWESYLSRSGLLGSREEEFYISGNSKPIAHAHNIFVQAIFDGGYLSGLAFLVYILVSLGYLIYMLLKRNRSFTSFFFALSLVGFLGQGLFEAGYSSLYHPLAFLFLLASIPYINKMVSPSDTQLEERKVI